MQDKQEYVQVDKTDQAFAQGDLFFRRVSALPKGLKPVKGGFLAVSSTEHHHVLEGGKVYTGTEPGQGFLVCSKEGARIKHLHPTKPHRPYQLEAGDVFEFLRQREDMGGYEAQVED